MKVKSQSELDIALVDVKPVRIGSDYMYVDKLMIMMMMPGTCAGEPSSQTSTS